jgi:hypothetical protein
LFGIMNSMKHVTRAVLVVAVMFTFTFGRTPTADAATSGWSVCRAAQKLVEKTRGGNVPDQVQKQLEKLVAACAAWKQFVASAPKTADTVPASTLPGTGKIDVAPSGAAYWWRDGAPRYVALPSGTFTPGMVDAEVTQDTLETTTCNPGYTGKYRVTRPTEKVRDVSTSQKNGVYKEYGLTKTGGQKYGVDHLVSLELGGANGPWTPNAAALNGSSVGVAGNLWPVPIYMTGDVSPGFGSTVFGAGKREKDRVENQLKAEVCDGRMLLRDAQTSIAGNWWAAYVNRCAAHTNPAFTNCDIANIPPENRM